MENGKGKSHGSEVGVLGKLKIEEIHMATRKFVVA